MDLLVSARPESDGGLNYLELRLGIYIKGPAHTRRNAALDILTGRAANEQVVASDPEVVAPDPSTPQRPLQAKPIPRAPVPVPPTRIQYRPARTLHTTDNALPPLDFTSHPSTSPWLAVSASDQPRFRIQRPAPPRPSRWPLVPMLLLATVAMSLVLTVTLVGRGSSERVDPVGPAAVVVDAAPDVVAPDVATTDSAIPIETPESLDAAQFAAPTPSIPAPASVLRVVMDERFTSNTRGWPSDPQATAWLAGGSYRLAARQAAHFVAVGIPGTQTLGDTVVTGWFRKVGGLAGGGYGLILRDQNPELRDGQNQLGHYYVFEVGDRGEVGVWLRDGDRWIDLLTWTRSDAVKPDTAANELSVTAAGDRLSFVVNGIPVASQTDTLLRTGAAGVFVGGDTNQVAVDRIVVSSTR